MSKALFFAAAMHLGADLWAAPGSDEDQIEVRLSVYFALSGEGEAYVMKLGKEPKTFTFKIEGTERLSLRMTPLGNCRVSVEVLDRTNVTMTRPLTRPAFFEPAATFAVGVHFPHHRHEVRGSVSGTGACSRGSTNEPRA